MPYVAQQILMSAEVDDAALRRRLTALRSMASLPPLALAVCATADYIIRDLVDEVAEDALREGTPVVPCSDAARSLLEGAAGSLPNDGKSISASLHKVLVQEAQTTALSSKRAIQVLGNPDARRQATGLGLDVFGNRPKEKANAETIVCTNCGISLSASRFAPHLERCMLGKGRKRTKVNES